MAATPRQTLEKPTPRQTPEKPTPRQTPEKRRPTPTPTAAKTQESPKGSSPIYLNVDFRKCEPKLNDRKYNLDYNSIKFEV